MDAPEISVKIYCLGHFRADREGVPLESLDHVQRKPLELVKTLIALGGRNVPEDQLTEALWPDAEGDAAHRAFKSALHRSRQMLGAETLAIRQRQLSLDPRFLWCDALEFEALAGEAERAILAGDDSALTPLLERALALYRGPFLEGEFDPPELLSARERLHSRYLRLLREAGQSFERAGRSVEAIRFYQKGVETDPVAEELYQCLMRAYAREGRAAEAEAAYQRLRRNLQAQGGIAPSAESEALHQQALRQRVSRNERVALPAMASMAAPPLTSMSGSPGNAIWTSAPPPIPEKPSIAVLPFQNMSGEPPLDYFSDGLAEDLITELSQYGDLTVVARNSSFRYKGKQSDIREVGRALGVRYVLEGSVRPSPGNERVRVTLQLADATSGIHIWAERYDRPLSDVFAIQEEIADHVAVAIDVKLLSGGQAADKRRSTKSYEAYRLFRLGSQRYAEWSPESLREAIDIFHQAVALDSGFSTAWGMLGFTYWVRWTFEKRENPEEDLRQAERYARIALALNPRQADAMRLLVVIHGYRREFKTALALSNQAIEMNPSDGNAVGARAFTLLLKGEYEPALADAKRALDLGPYPVGWWYSIAGIALFGMNNAEEAIPWLESAIRLSPKWRSMYVGLTAAYAEAGRMDDARRAARHLYEMDSTFSAEHLYQVHTGFSDPKLQRRWRAGLRAAGLK